MNSCDQQMYVRSLLFLCDVSMFLEAVRALRGGREGAGTELRAEALGGGATQRRARQVRRARRQGSSQQKGAAAARVKFSIYISFS